MFSGCTILPNSNETNLGRNNKEASLSAGKNTRVVLVPRAISRGVDIAEVPAKGTLSFQ